MIKKSDIVILDTSEIEDFIDYGGMLYELKKINICDGKEYQISNGGDLLMIYGAYEECRDVLDKFSVKAAR
ncbi:MAG: hypothetical protein ACE5EN_00625 [Nitrospinota bacterium]